MGTGLILGRQELWKKEEAVYALLADK